MVGSENEPDRPEEKIDDRFKRAPAEGGRKAVDDTLKEEEQHHSSRREEADEEGGDSSNKDTGE